MKFSDLQAANLQRCTSGTGFAHSLSDWRPSQWSNAMAGECGEVCNLTKKMDRHLDGTRGNVKPGDTDFASLLHRTAVEIGDVVIYADLLAQRLGTTLEDVVREAFNAKSEQIGSPVRI